MSVTKEAARGGAGLDELPKMVERWATGQGVHLLPVLPDLEGTPTAQLQPEHLTLEALCHLAASLNIRVLYQERSPFVADSLTDDAGFPLEDDEEDTEDDSTSTWSTQHLHPATAPRQGAPPQRAPVPASGVLCPQRRRSHLGHHG